VNLQAFIFLWLAKWFFSGPVMDMTKEIPFEALNTLHVSFFSS
jgi:hypothetical protein